MLDNKTKQSIFVITGMHRSGTSLTASLLESAGVDIGKRLLPPSQGNVKGYFENLDFVEFHEDVLFSQGISKAGWTLEKQIYVQEQYLERAKSIVQKNSVKQLWAWKDPRTTLFLNFWKSLLPELKFILVYRAPWEVIDSLYRRGNVGDEIFNHNPNFALKVWLNYNQAILNFYNQFPNHCILLDIYSLSNDPKFLIKAIEEKFGVSLDNPASDIYDASLLYTQISNPHRATVIRHYFPEVCKVYQELNQKALQLPGFSTLHPEAPQFSSYEAWVLQDWVDVRRLEKQESKAQAQLQQTQVELGESQAQLQQTQVELGESQAQLQQTQVELGESQAQLQHTQTELGESQAQLQHTQAELGESQAQLQHTQAELGQSQAQLQHTQAELGQSQAQLQHTQAELGQSQAQLQHTQAELGQSQAQLQHTQAELGQSQAQLQHTQAELQDSRSQLQQVQTQLERSQAQLQQTKIEKQRSQAQLQQTQVKLNNSQAQFQQVQTELEQSQARLQHTQAELGRSQALISGMESSKFWKLRTAWFRIKQVFGFTDIAALQATESATINEISEISNLEEINFKPAAKNSLNGCFEGVNGSSRTELLVQNATLITIKGWAVIPEENRTADKVIITYGRTKHLVAVASVNLERPDVVAAFNNSAYRNSGWSITINSAILPTGKAVLKAWAYNATRKEATPLNKTNLGIGISNLFPKLKYYYAVLRVKGTRYALAKLSKKIYYKLDKSQPPIEVLPVASPHDQPYSKWLSKNYPREADLRKMAEMVDLFGYQPTISVIMPVYNAPEHFLREAIESVLNQVYPYWELCIADDASTKPYIRSVLKEYISKDSRIKVVFRSENGHISRASNSALEIATGEFVALLDHDDLLTPDALYEVALLLNKHSEADMIYSDEDKIDDQNQLKEPFFKPDWSPDSFLSRMYTCHLGTYRRSLVTEIGGFRAGYEGSQDYDFVLRITEKTENIFHIPKILYHWRIHPTSTASSLDSKNYAVEAAQKSLADAINRRGEPGEVIPAPGPAGYHIVRYNIDKQDLVSIIIPTRNLGSIVDHCLLSIFEKTTYPNYEVILIDNGSTEQTTLDVIRKWKDKEPSKFKCYSLDIPFNYSKINNFAVEQAKGKYLLFLNNDTEVVTEDWIEAMVEQAQRQSIGAVGALLLYPDNTIQHAGVVAGIGGVANHCHKHFTHGSPGYFNHINTINNFSAVTAACLMCRRQVFEEVGGFEEELSVAFNDIDFCFKLVDKGYRNVYLPHVVLYHYESKSRGIEDTPEKLERFLKENEYMLNKWKDIIKNDPCYNPNLSRSREDYSINI